MAPFVPLPSILMPAPPSMIEAGPSGAAGGLRIGTSILEGANFTMGAVSKLKGLAGSGKGNPLAE
jgi:hypothetical protein